MGLQEALTAVTAVTDDILILSSAADAKKLT